jgi:hypothetical protein
MLEPEKTDAFVTAMRESDLWCRQSGPTQSGRLGSDLLRSLALASVCTYQSTFGNPSRNFELLKVHPSTRFFVASYSASLLFRWILARFAFPPEIK